MCGGDQCSYKTYYNYFIYSTNGINRLTPFIPSTKYTYF